MENTVEIVQKVWEYYESAQSLLGEQDTPKVKEKLGELKTYLIEQLEPEVEETQEEKPERHKEQGTPLVGHCVQDQERPEEPEVKTEQES